MTFLKIIFDDKSERNIAIKDLKQAEKTVEKVRWNQKVKDASRMYKLNDMWYTIPASKVVSIELVEV